MRLPGEERVKIASAFFPMKQKSQRDRPSPLWSDRESSQDLKADKPEAPFREGGHVASHVTHPWFRSWLPNVESEFITRSLIRTILASLARRIKRIQSQSRSDES